LQVYEQVVPLQLAAEALVSVHALPQPPQLAVVLVGVSHPSVSAPAFTQSANPAPQVYEQLVPLHDAAVAFDGVHTTPQPPQFDVVLVAVSHPSVLAPALAQSANPPLQV
jgi:hypothetical protein